MNLTDFERICNKHDCDLEVSDSGHTIYVEIEAKKGYVFSGTESHILCTTYYSHPKSAYKSALNDMMLNLPLEKCEIENCDWCYDV